MLTESGYCDKTADCDNSPPQAKKFGGGPVGRWACPNGQGAEPP